MKPPREAYEAAVVLSNIAAPFVAMLEARLESHKQAAITQRDEVSMRWAQGRGMETEDILKFIREAEKHLTQ